MKVKKILLRLLLAKVLIIGIITINTIDLYAQAPCSIDYTQTTDPDAPSNKKFTLRPNFFRWVGEQTFDIYSDVITNPNSLYSPFFQDGNPIVNVHYEFKDYTIEDGWELIREEFGYQYDANGNNTQRPQPQTNPYIVFYNRYSGIIRVFAAIGRLENGYSSARLQLKYDITTPTGFKTNNFHEATQIKPLVALDKVPNGIPSMVAVSEFSNTRRHWFWADFVAVYDPCSCLHKSLITIELKLINDALVEFETDGKLVEVVNGSSEVRDNAGNVSLGFSDLVAGGKKAYEQYKSINEFSSKETAAVDKYRDLKKLSDSASVKAAANTPLLTKAISELRFIYGGLKLAPFIGAAIPLFEMFLGGGDNDGTANKAPLVMRNTSKSSGHITATNLYQGISFGLPGGDMTDFSDERKPYYNNPLGVFNILYTPKLNYHVNVQNTTLNEGGDCHFIDNIDIYRYRLADDIRYVINPATGLEWENGEDVDILAALVVEFDNVTYRENDNASFAYFKQGNFEYKYSSPNALMVHEGPGVYRTQYVPLGCLKDIYAEFNIRRFKTLERWSCNVNVWNPPTSVPYTPVIYPARFYVKLIVNLKRKNPTPTTQNVLYIGKYFAETGLEKTNATDWQANSWFSIFRNVTLNSAITTSQTVRAWEKITIAPGFSLSNGATLTAIAGENIVIEPEVIVPPEATLKIDMPVECTTVIDPVSSNDLTNFCGSSSYNENARDFSKDPGDGGSEYPKPGIILSAVEHPLPNPFSNVTTLQYTVGEASLVKITVTNSLGQQVAVLTEGFATPGNYYTNLYSSNLPSGNYFIVVRIGTFLQTERVILIK